MNKSRIANFNFILAFCILFSACQNKTDSGNEDVVETRTPVSITSVNHEVLKETVELNATSAFLLKTNVKVNANGYLQRSNFKIGDLVKRGDILFEMKTKEAMSLDNTINLLDTSFHFNGTINIKAPSGGYITALDHQAGEYVLDGDQVATISDLGSFAFILNLPYELTPYLPQNNSLILKLPDGTTLNGTIDRAMPTVDVTSQTQNYILKISAGKMIPENLIAKVLLIKKSKSNVLSLPKEAVLTNETESEFWIMKLINDSIAVKIPVQIGMEGSGRIEILTPVLNESDRILLTGNYGLPDTAKVYLIDQK